MVLAKRLILLSFICSFFVYSLPSWAMVDIYSIEDVTNKVHSLLQEKVKPEEICIVFDYHGVIVEQETHTPPLHLKGAIKETLEDLREKKIPSLVATAWPNFDAVIQGSIVLLGLQGFFDVDPTYNSQLKHFKVSNKEVKIIGYQNGRVFALKDANSSGLYFRQKAYAVELAYPQNTFKYILFVDDSPVNLNIFLEDSFYIKSTENDCFTQLILYNLKSRKKETSFR